MWYLYGLTLLAGVANAIEPGQNATLARVTGQPMLAGLVCFAMAIVGLAAALAVARRCGGPDRTPGDAPPWWAWPGGILGAVIVLTQLHVSERIGAAPFLSCVITAGVIGSIALDHFGWVGFERRRASRRRLLGAAAMVAGVALVAAF